MDVGFLAIEVPGVTATDPQIKPEKTPKSVETVPGPYLSGSLTYASKRMPSEAGHSLSFRRASTPPSAANQPSPGAAPEPAPPRPRHSAATPSSYPRR